TAALKKDAAQRVVLTPSGKRVPLQDEGSEVMELTESGFYELRARDKDVVVALSGGANSSGGKEQDIPLTPEAQERSQRLWWYLLVAGLLLLGADTLMSNRLAKT